MALHVIYVFENVIYGWPCLDVIYGCPLYRVLQVAQASFTIENFAKQNFLFQKKPERPVILEAVIYGWLFAWTSFMNAPAPSPPPYKIHMLSNI